MQIICTFVAVTKLSASRPWKIFTPPPLRAALNQQHNVVRFPTLRVLRCILSPNLRCSCCNVAQFFCDLEACNLVAASTVSVQ